MCSAQQLWQSLKCPTISRTKQALMASVPCSPWCHGWCAQQVPSASRQQVPWPGRFPHGTEQCGTECCDEAGSITRRSQKATLGH